MLDLSREALSAAVAQGAVFGVRSPHFPLTLYCYTRRCMYDGLWTPVTMAARGLVMSDTGEIVCAPMPKFFNFELIHPANRIIVDYGSRFDLVLLSVRHTATGEDVAWSAVQSIALLAGVPVPNTCAGMSLRNLSLPNTGFEEGIVAWFPRLGHRVKAKPAEYLQAHRVLAGLGPRMILDLMEAQRLDAVRDSIPAQYHDQFDDVVARVRADAGQLRAQADAYYERLHLAQTVAPGTSWTRKDQALWIQQHAPKDLHALLFAMPDRKPIEPIIASRLRASYRTAQAVAVVEDDA